ncbi:MAG: VCBS repeat-containing protein, partial [Bacteroidota bacterium]
MLFRFFTLASLVSFFLLTCEREQAPHLLSLVPAAQTGVDFVNQLTETDSVNIMVYEYLYNGGGVGVGDFDRNGLPDLVFTGNMVSSRLYLQLEPWQFTDVTAAAGLLTDVWVSGVNVGDINDDGREDIYFSVLNPDGTLDSPNLFYLNEGKDENGVPTFREAAKELGLADERYGTHSAWFDLENDGDLDLYVLNNSTEAASRKMLRGTDTSGTARSLDIIYENVGSPGKPSFRPTTINKTEGWGLGVVPQDFNGDGYTDFYIGNDFISDDGYLINDQNGGFKWNTKQAFVHTSQHTMGVDAGDLNNDGYPDILSADMLPDDNLRLKTMFARINHPFDAKAATQGYMRQYVRNTVQINNGNGTYSDYAFITGVAATDWSWAPMIADFDNDGHRDIFISNGYPRDVTNRDFVDFGKTTAVFGTDEEIMRKIHEALLDVPGVHQPNYIYQNLGGMQFRISDWVTEDPTYSNGAVYVD